MSAILREESPDPWYTRFWTSARDQEILDYIVAPSIARFAEAGYKTAIVLKKDAEHYLIHCLAVTIQGERTPKAVSQVASAAVGDSIHTQSLQEATIEPNQVSFF